MHRDLLQHSERTRIQYKLLSTKQSPSPYMSAYSIEGIDEGITITDIEWQTILDKHEGHSIVILLLF